MFGLLKRLVPPTFRRQYHHLIALVASLVYRFPSRHLIVVGVTGTDGKTTTASLIADVLGAGGEAVGLSSSAMMQVGPRRWLNETHQTMPGRFQLQRLLRQMVNAGCHYAVIEVSSEGTVQYRHSGIDFDVAVITNLTPEHLEAHGSFESYRKAKGLLFTSIIRGGDKHLFGRIIPKATVVNLDDESHDYFLKFWAEAHYGTSLRGHESEQLPSGDKLTVIAAEQSASTATNATFRIDGRLFVVPLPGLYNIQNALQAIAVGRALGLEWPMITAGLEQAHPVPGRGESIDSGRGWRAIVDYALTPNALEQLLQSLRHDGAKRIIAVLGAAGGGRDTWKRPKLGAIAARYADRIILTTDDPYDESPAAIAAAIAAGVPESEREKLETILDRRLAIRRAIAVAQPGDVVTITGMGSETSMMVGRHSRPWNDAAVVKEELASRP